MAKKFRLGKSFFSGSSHSLRRLSEAAKGKSVARSLDIDFPMGRQLLSWDVEQDMVLDDFGPEDFEAGWVWPSRLARSRATTEAKIREYSDPDYEPWEEVSSKWDHSDSENMDSKDGISLCPMTLVSWFLLVMLLWILRLAVTFMLSGSSDRCEKLEEPGNHSAVEVKVKEPSLMVNQPCSPDPQKSHKGCIDALEAWRTPHLIKLDMISKDSVSGPQNLRAKRIVAFWRYRVEDCDGSTTIHSDSQKQKKVDGIEGTDGCNKPIPPSLWSKRKRETVTEEDPHSYRAPQRHAFL
ncbi:hypothetical protein RHMOL_Rhmol05G0156100 [Rhododendron molle]|uniref:Uncharacterized protein n=1 Tax=Rhododendron molle TaxID=49168 RepID=A0ACC0NQP1_RHOML|nr:hypothetical protein RHMOL_Rhmol05G0156100 [Rhododendron molle]